MMPFRRRYAPDRDQRPGVFEDLERLLRRVRAAGLAAPLLLVIGFGVGNATNERLDLPGDVVVHEPLVETVPRVHLEILSRHMERWRSAGLQTEQYVEMYKEHVAPIEEVLRNRGVNEATARQVAWPLVQHSYRRGLDPAFVLSIVLLESGGKPRATSFVGARGLMQVMPSWSGHWRECGRDLYDIDANLCNGTNILAWYLRSNPGDERRALLGYNGCVRGTNTPNCSRYPDRIARLKHQVQREINSAREQSRPGGAASR